MQQQDPEKKKQDPQRKKKSKKRQITIEEAIQLTMERFKKDIEYLKDH